MKESLIRKDHRSSYGEFHVVSTTPEEWDEDGYSGTCFAIVEVESNLRPANVVECLLDSLRDEPCGHSHDCCGCVRWRAFEANHFNGSTYIVRMSGTRNI